MEDGSDCWREHRICSGCGEKRPLAGLSEASLCSCDWAEIKRSLDKIKKVQVKNKVVEIEDVREQTNLRKKPIRKNRKHRN